MFDKKEMVKELCKNKEFYRKSGVFPSELCFLGIVPKYVIFSHDSRSYVNYSALLVACDSVQS
jgi:hypothetical protein